MATKIPTPLLVIGGIVLIFLVFLTGHMSQEIKKLRSEVDQNKKINLKIRRRLLSFLKDNQDLNPQVANELLQICALLEIKQETKAMFSLAKIIENLLRELLHNDIKFTTQKPEPSFSDCLEYAKERKILSSEDYHVISMLRIIRNEEAHTLNVTKDESKLQAAFVTGLAFVFTLTKMLRQTLTDSTAVA